MLEDGFSYTIYYPVWKRKKLTEDFEALSIEDDSSTWKINNSDKWSKQMLSDANQFKQDYYRKGCGCGKRRKWRMFLQNKALLDFSELTKQIQSIEHHLNSAVQEKNLLNWINPMLVNFKKKRVEKEMSKELAVVAWSQDSNEKRIVKLIIKCKEIFPKLYNRLIDIYSIYASKADLLLTSDQNIFNLNNLGSEGKKSCQVVVDDFVTKVNQYTISSNSKLANEVILNMIKRLDEDYEMVGIDVK